MPSTTRRPPPEPPRLARLWPPVRDVLAFAVGAFILIHETLVTGAAQRPWIIAAGVACLGVAGSGAAQRWLLSRLEAEK